MSNTHTFPGITNITNGPLVSSIETNNVGDLVVNADSGTMIVNGTVQATTLMGTLVPPPQTNIDNFASLSRLGTQVLASNNAVIFTDVDMHGTVTIDGTMTTVTIGTTGYYIVIAGITKSAGTGMTMGLRVNGSVPPGILQFNNSPVNVTNARQWILPFNAGDTVQLINAGGSSITIDTTVSAYLNFIQIRQ